MGSEVYKKDKLLGDAKIVWMTVKKVFIRKNITESSEEIDVTLDYGDVLLKSGKVDKKEYDALQAYAKKLIKEHEDKD